MWQRMNTLWADFRARLNGETEDPAAVPDRNAKDAEIEFQSLSASEAAAQGRDQELICPVTRKSLKKGARLYLCRACNTSYSPEGWEFLKKTDKGRCCNCRERNSVFPTF